MPYAHGNIHRFFIDGFPLDEEGLSDVRKVEVTIEFGCGPYFAGFNPAVIRRIVPDKTGIVSIFRTRRDILKKSGLVVLDGKMVMSITFPDEIIGDIAPGEQGICGNFLAHGFSICGQTFVLLTIHLVPALEGTVELHRIRMDEHITDGGQTGYGTASVLIPAAETLPGLLSRAFCPVRDSRIASHSTQGCRSGNG